MIKVYWLSIDHSEKWYLVGGSAFRDLSPGEVNGGQALSFRLTEGRVVLQTTFENFYIHPDNASSILGYFGLDIDGLTEAEVELRMSRSVTYVQATDSSQHHEGTSETAQLPLLEHILRT